jgi:cytochrome b561
MSLRNTTVAWGSLAKLFHWLIVFMIIGQIALAQIAEDLPLGMEKLATLARHKSLGITILALASLRLAWRWLNPTPLLPAGMKPWERGLARLSHFLLYFSIFAIPLTGWMMSSAKNYPVSWFNLLQLPDLVAPNERTYEFMHDSHGTLVAVMLTTALLHVVGALKHHFLDRDTVLRRMLPFSKLESSR